MERARAATATCSRVRIAQEGTWVFLSDPEAIKQVFTAPPDVLHAGEANAVLRPWLGDNSVLLLDGPQHLAQRKLLLPPFHGERMQRYGDAMADIARARGRDLAHRPAAAAVAADAGGHPRGDRARPSSATTTPRGWTACASRLRDAAELTTQPRTMLQMARARPRPRGRIARLPRAHGAGRRRDLRGDRARRRRQGDLSERDDILSLLLQARHEDGTPMSDQELRDELMTS